MSTITAMPRAVARSTIWWTRFRKLASIVYGASRWACAEKRAGRRMPVKPLAAIRSMSESRKARPQAPSVGASSMFEMLTHLPRRSVAPLVGTAAGAGVKGEGAGTSLAQAQPPQATSANAPNPANTRLSIRNLHRMAPVPGAYVNVDGVRVKAAGASEMLALSWYLRRRAE